MEPLSPTPFDPVDGEPRASLQVHVDGFTWQAPQRASSASLWGGSIAVLAAFLLAAAATYAVAGLFLPWSQALVFGVGTLLMLPIVIAPLGVFALLRAIDPVVLSVRGQTVSLTQAGVERCHTTLDHVTLSPHHLQVDAMVVRLDGEPSAELAWVLDRLDAHRLARGTDDDVPDGLRTLCQAGERVALQS